MVVIFNSEVMRVNAGVRVEAEIRKLGQLFMRAISCGTKLFLCWFVLAQRDVQCLPEKRSLMRLSSRYWGPVTSLPVS